MATNWYYEDGGERKGPVDSKSLKRLTETGVIQPSSLVWREGMEHWVKAGSVKGLLSPSPTSEPKRSTVSEHSVTPITDSAANTPVDRRITFKAWYKTTWLSGVPQYAQILIWLVYGFIWIPVWYLMTGQRGTPQTQWRSPSAMRIGIGCCGVLCVLFVLGAISTILNPDSPRGTSSGSGSSDRESITERFYPFERGRRRQFSRTVYFGKGEIQSRIEHEFGENGIILEKMISQFIPGGGNVPTNGTRSIHFRIEDGLIETGQETEYSNGMVWSPILKIGATKGESWERKFDNGLLQSYRVTGFETREIHEQIDGGGKAECVIVEMSMTAPVGPETIVESVFARGVGLVRERAWVVEDGNRELTRSDIIMPVLKE